jgi:hypothetical protein
MEFHTRKKVRLKRETNSNTGNGRRAGIFDATMERTLNATGMCRKLQVKFLRHGISFAIQSFIAKNQDHQNYACYEVLTGGIG